MPDVSALFSSPAERLKFGEKSFSETKYIPPVSKVLVDSRVPVGFKAAMDAFDVIVKAIKGMDDGMPSALVQASPVSEMLRYNQRLWVCCPVVVRLSVSGSCGKDAFCGR